MGDKFDEIARTVVCIPQICRGHRYTKEYRTHSFLCDEQAAKVAQAIRMAVEEGKAEEREACAVLTETFFDWCGPIGEDANMAVAQSFAKESSTAIRSRSQS